MSLSNKNLYRNRIAVGIAVKSLEDKWICIEIIVVKDSIAKTKIIVSDSGSGFELSDKTQYLLYNQMITSCNFMLQCFEIYNQLIPIQLKYFS